MSIHIFLIAAQFEARAIFYYLSTQYTDCLICYYKYTPTQYSFVSI